MRDLRLAEFQDAMTEAVTVRLGAVREPTTFKADRNGHLIKLVTGIIQHYGALTFEEIDSVLRKLGCVLGADDLFNFLLCSDFLGWIREESRGLRTFYAARDVESALVFNFLPGRLRDRVRWRSDIREYWREHQPDRFRSLTAAMAA